MLVGTALYVRLMVYMGLSLFMIRGALCIYGCMCIYAYNLTGFFRLISRVTPADLLVASMAAKPF